MDKKPAIFIGTAVLLFTLFIIFLVISRNKIVEVDIRDIDKILKNKDFSLVYVGENNKVIKKYLKQIKKEYLIDIYTSSNTKENIKEILDESDIKVENFDLPLFMLYNDIDLITVFDQNDSTSTILNKYIKNIIPPDEVKYKVAKNANEYIKRIYKKDYVITVFGSTSCSFCDLYLPIINNVADKYNLDIYYFDTIEYNQKEYEKILDTRLSIPAKCNDGKNVTIADSFPKPMTLITKSGKTVDCIKGYVTEKDVIEKLQSLKIIKE